MTLPEQLISDKFRGQWGGKTESGEEMWWSEPNPRIMQGRRSAILRFQNDVRQFFLLRFLRKATLGLNRPKVIDFGCGTGGLTLNFSRVLECAIHGYDIFPTQIEIANSQAKKWGSPSQFFLLNEKGRFPLESSSVDAIFSADVLGHVPDIPAVLEDWRRVLKIGGAVALFTEASYSSSDQSLMARLARNGLDMCAAVPEHISLFPREKLESMFAQAGFTVEERYSANLLHWWFFPKDYVLMFERAGRKCPVYWASWIWNRVSKLIPFYPQPLEFLRLLLIRAFGKSAFGTGYFYFLRKIG